MEEENRSLDVEEEKGIEKGKMEPVAADGSAGGQKALELKEKKRRLVLSDSEDSDNDFRVSLRQKPVSKAERNRGRQMVRKKDAVERLKREEIKGEQKKMVVSADIQRRREEAAVVRKEALELSWEKKRRRDDSDSEIPAERIKAEPLRYARRNAEVSGEKKMRTDSAKHGAVRMKTRTEKVLDYKPAIPPDKWRTGCNDSKINSTPSNLNKSCKFESAGRRNDSLNGRRMECRQSYLNKSRKLEGAERHSDDHNKSGIEYKKSDSNSGSKLEAADRKKGILEERTTQSKSSVSNKLNKLEADHPCRHRLRDGRTEAEKVDLDKAVNRETHISQRDGTEEEGAEAKIANSNKPNKLETADGLGDEPTRGGMEANKVDSEKSAKPEADGGQRDGIEDGRNESKGIESSQSRKAEAAAIKKDNMDNRRSEDEEDILNKSRKPEVSDGGRVVMEDGRIEAKEEDSDKLSKLQMADGHAGNTVNGSIEAQKADTEKTSNSQADRRQHHNPLDNTIACKIHSDKSSKPVAADRWGGAPVSKVANLNKSNRPEAEKNTLMEHPVQKTLHGSKSRSSHFLGVKEKDCGIMKGKAIKVQGRDGILGVMPTKKKTGGLQRSQFVREDEESGNTLLCPTAANRIISAKHSSVSGERKILKRSFHDSARRQSDFGERLTAKKYRFDRVKAQSKSSSKRSPKNDSLSNANDVLSKVKSRSNKETHLLDNQQTESPSTSRGTARQKLREQLKGILLNAGWKIDLKPRRGRNYEDKVYVSPDGRGYWSITKAYTVFQQQLDSADGEEHKKFLGKSSKRSVENHNLEGPSSPIAIEVLDILKRNVVNKRRSREELEEVLTKTGNLKRRKNEKKLIEGMRRRRKPKNTLDTSTISSNDFTSQKPHILSRYSNNKRGCALLVRGANQEAESESDDYVPYVWKRTVLSWMIDLGIVPINGVVKYMNRRRTRAMLEGRITRDGIHCNCCSKILSVAKFELHAGSKLHQPYENIYVDKPGISLLQCQLNAWEKQDISEKKSFYTINIEGDDPNDDTCGICGDGGDLICCDGCPSTFHLSCLGIKMLPSGDWLCTNCSCKFCREASGSLSLKSCESSYTLLSCSLCEEKYHENCLPKVDAVPSNLGNACITFCGKKCKKVFEGLQKLIGVKNELEAGFSWSLICRFDEDSSRHSCGLPQRAECNSKIAVALAVMDECFLPITDDRSGINLIHNVVYNCGSNFNRLNYSGFYTFILERGDEIISAASVRIHGTRLAEMPFIGTRNMYRRQGMCRRLLLGIESALTSLNVEKLMIPAISELTETWTTVFGFKPLDVSQRKEVRTVNILVFPGTGLLQKTLFRRDSAEHSTSTADVNVAESATEHHCIPDVANASSSASSVDTKLPAPNEVNIQCKIEANDTKSNLCAFGGSINSASGVSVVSSVQPELPPDKILVNCKYEAKDTEPDNHGCGGSVNSTSDVLSDRAFRFQYEDHKPLETAADGDFSVQPELVDGKKSSEDAELLVETPDETQVILPHDSTVHGNCKLENGESGSFLKLPCAGDTRVKSTSGDIRLSQATFASTLQDCRRSNLQVPICPLGSRRDAIHFDRSGVELGGQSSSKCIGNAIYFDGSEVEQGIQPSDCDGDHTKYPIEASGFDSSEANNGSIHSMLNVSGIPPKESRFVGLQCGTHVVKAEVTAVESEPYPSFSDNDNLSFKIVSRCLNVTPVNDTQISSNVPIGGQNSLDSVQESFDVEEKSYTQQPNSCIIDGSKIGTEPNRSPDIKDVELTSESPDSSDAASSSEVKDSPAVVSDVSIASNEKNLLDASSTSDIAISRASARLPYKISGDSKDATSFRILNNLPSSTVIPVQHELPSDDKVSSDAPAAPGHICDERASDASVSQDLSAT